jgi:hypothetical protein
MSWTMWALFWFAVGWLLHAGFFNPDTSVLKYGWLSALLGQQPPQNWRRVCARVVIGLVFIGSIAGIILLSPEQELGLEEWVVRSGVPWALLWLWVGFWTHDHWTAIRNHLEKLFDASLGKQHQAPWALQAALAVLILFVTLLVFRPDLFDKLTSLRAGNVEIDLQSSSGKLREAAANSGAPRKISA